MNITIVIIYCKKIKSDPNPIDEKNKSDKIQFILKDKNLINRLYLIKLDKSINLDNTCLFLNFVF